MAWCCMESRHYQTSQGRSGQVGDNGLHLSTAGTACMDRGVDVGRAGVPVEVVLGRVLVLHLSST